MSVTCQECGKELESAGTKHTLEDCGKYHLRRGLEILHGKLNLAGINKAKMEAEYTVKVLTVLEDLLENAK